MDQEELRRRRARTFLRVKLLFTVEIFAISGGISAILAGTVSWVIAPRFDYLFMVVFLFMLLAGIVLFIFLLFLLISFVHYRGTLGPTKPARPSIVAAFRETVDFLMLKGLRGLWRQT